MTTATLGPVNEYLELSDGMIPDWCPCPTCGHRFDEHQASGDGTLQWCLGGGYTDETEYGTPKCLCRWFE